MIKNVVLGTMTMNAGKGVPGSTIKWALKYNYNQFERIIVIDGDLTEEAKEFYSQFSNVKVVDSPWKDSYVDQYRAFFNELNDEEWGLWLDDDEVLSEELKQYLKSSDFIENTKTHNTHCLPCVLYLTEDDEKYFAAEKNPEKEYKGQWFKNILCAKKDIEFKHFGSHVIPNHGSKEKGLYVPYPYYHMKSLESFVYNDVWQAFLSPEGQGYSPQESSMFKMLTKMYKNTKEFKLATKNESWTPPLKKFAWDKRLEYNRPISRLAWVYWILEKHPRPEEENNLTWENVSKYVLDEEKMKIYQENKTRLGINIHE